MKIPKKGNIYSINESNCKGWGTRVKNYVDKLKDSGYTKRLNGTMVADVHRTLFKGYDIFTIFAFIWIDGLLIFLRRYSIKLTAVR
ncbi:Fructose-1,6-bisphosphatase [Candidatus Magnetoovum chiemensis]|nr:Fructose-1,6-bisphosphatase [Candidatus Magnetoovum chiemensis]